MKLLEYGYHGILVVLCIFCIHRLYLLYLKRNPLKRVILLNTFPEGWPWVTIQLPVYNERLVIEKLLRTVGEVEYPRQRLEIQVLDDSTDDTSTLIAQELKLLKSRGIDISHIRRVNRVGFKAGALANGLQTAKGEFIAIFDADFIPPPDFLIRALPQFDSHEVGMVQARWGHVNGKHSLLTQVQSLMLDGHFHIEQEARSNAGLFFNFNGTAGVWRKSAIESSGGWQADTLTEDLDLSYRAQLKGWRFRYLSSLRAPAELPVKITALKTQQHRWAKGSIETAKKLLPQIVRAPLPLRVRLEAIVHLTNNGAYVILALLALLSPFAPNRAYVNIFLVLSTISLALYFGEVEREKSGHFWKIFLRLPLLIAMGVGLSFNNSVAVMEGLWGRKTEFLRTPKQGRFSSFSYPAVANRWVLSLETWMTLYLAFALIRCIVLKAWWSLPFHTLFFAGAFYVTLMTFAEKIQARYTS